MAVTYAQMSTLDGLLKDVYLEPLREEIRVESDPLSSRILQSTKHVVGSNKIVHAYSIYANGGIGAGTETGALPNPAPGKAIQIETTLTNHFGTIKLSDKVIKGIKGPGAGSYINALNMEVRGMTETAKWNQGRQIYGNGVGNLITLKANNSSSAIVEPASGGSVKTLIAGLSVDLHKTSDNTVYSGGSGLRIIDVDFVSNKMTLDTAIVVVSGDYLTIQGSYNLEMLGMGKIFEAQPYTTETLYGANRADYSFLRPTIDTSFGEIDEWKLQQFIVNLERHWKGKINWLSMGDTVMGYYFDLLNQRRQMVNRMTLEGGYEAISFGNLPIMQSDKIGADEIDLLDTSLWSMEMLDDWDWIPGTKGGILNQVAGYPIYTGSMAKYCNMVCRNPAMNAKLTGVTAVSA